MPVPKDELNPSIFGSIATQIMNILEKGEGYYFDELKKKIKCEEKSLYRELSNLSKKGWILSKTIPEFSKRKNRAPQSKIFYITPEYQKLR